MRGDRRQETGVRRLALGVVLGLAVLYAQAPKGNPQNGKAVFEKNGCWQCHGHQGQGGLAGPRLAQTRLNLNGFTNFLRNPPSGGMPPYRVKVMSDQEVADVFAYVQTFQEPAKNIPLLNP